MKKGLSTFLISFLILFSLVIKVQAQANELTIKFSRDFGYSAIGSNRIQGLFSISASSTQKLEKVTYFLDNEKLGEVNEEPYKLQFNTDDFRVGQHSIYAEGIAVSGEIIKSKEVTFTFISSKESRSETLKLIGPILGLALVVALLSALVPALRRKKKGTLPMGTQRNYGAAGGAICKKCNRPFERHVMSPNLILGKLEMCPHCGKWGIYRTLPIDVLRDAENEELALNDSSDSSVEGSDADELIKKELDDSRFEE
jgi:hypothetical protein